MAFLTQNKSSSSGSSASVYDGVNEISAGQGAPVSSCLHIRSEAGAGASTAVAARQLLDKDVVLRRLRSHKRVTQIDAALRSIVRTSQGLVDEVHGPSKWWLDDAFSSP